MLGLAALSAGFIGRNIPTLVGSGCASLLLVWVAMRNLRSAFGSTQSRRLELNGTASPGYLQNPGADSMTPDRGSAIYYDRKKLCIRAAARCALCALLAWVIALDLHRNPVITSLVLAGLGFSLWRVATALSRAVDKDLTAITWDDEQIFVRTLTSARRVPWPSVELVDTTRRVLRLLGVIPVWRSDVRYLVFRLRQNGSSYKMKIPAYALTMRPGTAEELICEVVRRHARRAGDPAGFQRQADAVGRRMRAQPIPGARETGAYMIPEAAEWTRGAGADDRRYCPVDCAKAEPSEAAMACW